MFDGANLKDIVVAIDASRNRSGGAVVHIKGILSSMDPSTCGVKIVHIWSYKKLLDQIPDAPWLVKHCPEALNKSLIHQVWWQFFTFSKLVKNERCDVLLTTDAGSVCTFTPSVVMSRDMLSFEVGEIDRFKWSKSWWRLFLLRYIQIRSLRKATGALFLTNYASKTIQKFTGKLALVKIIPHGIAEIFRKPIKVGDFDKSTLVNCLYVSNADLYKHQWHVVEAFKLLNIEEYNVHLTLIGAKAGHPKALEKLAATISTLDSSKDFLTVQDFLPHDKIPDFLANADLFIFASSCENMPNTLIEAMASGLPIACSNRGPMPEVLGEGGVYFDPEDAKSIAEAVKCLIDDKDKRAMHVALSKKFSDEYSWKRCATETWQYLYEISKIKSQL